MERNKPLVARNQMYWNWVMGRQSCPAKEKGPVHPPLPTAAPGPCLLPDSPSSGPGHGRTRCVGRGSWSRTALIFCSGRPNEVRDLTQKSPQTLQETQAFLLGARSHLELSLPRRESPLPQVGGESGRPVPHGAQSHHHLHRLLGNRDSHSTQVSIWLGHREQSASSSQLMR